MARVGAIKVNRIRIINSERESGAVNSRSGREASREETAVGQGRARGCEGALSNGVFLRVEVEFDCRADSRIDHIWGKGEAAVADFDDLRVGGYEAGGAENQGRGEDGELHGERNGVMGWESGERM
ncbi:hypothetical protein G7Y89_g14600 [Cudoniella acicularis]|uniref:Uncharacterized protein n=1 Tax=Cudoniella acicularis TaxID=354080 RepID=A0A8H4VRY5_9HELO|nr:hypothetical protein G7Y89_g14600 [Cudoniella acicularis]